MILKKYFNQLNLLVALLLIFSCFNLQSQSIKIPEVMYFGGMKLNLSKGAREIIEKDYISIMRNTKYFATITQRADLYFPIIEQVFKEEAAPADFKFLALQESSLQSDVVSTSNAVGYWQFKKESAQEVGLQVDSNVDERKNIVASSRGAAKYLKKSNLLLNNWVYTLLAYYLGRGGVMPFVKEKYRNSNEMDIDHNMNWYVLRFLAHKFAYENVVGQAPHPLLKLALYKDCNGKSLKQIAEEKNIEIGELENFNKWLSTPKVPEGRAYTIILPYKIDRDISGENVVLADRTETQPIKYESLAVASKPKKIKKTEKSEKDLAFSPLDLPVVVTHNKLRAVQARKSDSFAKLAFSGNNTVDQFLSHNELQNFDTPIVGQLYYVEAKRNKALIPYHTVKAKETLWSIAQMYGVRTASIRKKNRMKTTDNIHVNQVLNLKKRKPKNLADSPNVTASTPLFMKTQEIDNASVAPTEPEKPMVKEIESKPLSTVIEPGTELKINKPLAEAPPLPTDNLNPKLTHNNANVINLTKSTDSTQIVTIEAGQTLYGISKTYEISVDSLKKWNQLSNNEIALGQQLIVKKITNKSISSIAGTNSYTVKKGDTIYKIARENGVRVEDIMLWNNKITTNVSIGEVILIKK